MNHSSIIQQPVAPVVVTRNRRQGIKSIAGGTISVTCTLTENILNLGVYISHYLMLAP
jgi:uncharacterized ParB-like nuclease family protein